jgi:two-component system, NtrC family, sensor kinase
MRKYTKILLLLLVPVLGMAQQQYPDSLKRILKNADADSVRYSALNGLGEYYVELNGDSALYYFNQALAIARKNDRGINEGVTLARIGYVLVYKSKYPESLECFQQALKFAQDTVNKKTIWNPNMPWIQYSTQQKNNLTILAGVHLLYATIARATGDPDQQILQLKIAAAFAKKAGDYNFEGVADTNLGQAYRSIDRLDSALVLDQNAEQIFGHTGYKKYLGGVLRNIGIIYLTKRNSDLAAQYFRKAIKVSIEQKNLPQADASYSYLINYFYTKKQKDSSLYYAKKRLEIVRAMNRNEKDEAYEDLYRSYQLVGNTDSAYKYQGLALAARDRNYETTIKSLADFQKLSFKEQLRSQELEKEKAAAQTRARIYVLLAAIGILMLLAAIFYRNNRQKYKANKVLESTLHKLKTTQTQLIQSEKMASLGELTAGIAHEIQNPLNFVNNFSEVSIELLQELKQEEAAGNKEDVIAIADDLTQNLQKINHHGKRADAIVKGMLEHSRTRSGQKELTAINALADEYLRLSYHGLRAKDKSFDAEIITHFDEKLPKINVVPQDIGRVMLNLLNNAFYAVNEKKKTGGADYKPKVSLTTLLENEQAVIKVKDNGIGMSDTIKDKIMQPFFTTKPTGEGTGLGLSLTYDMVVKGHGGSIQVNSIEGESSEFIVTLPIS